MPVREIYSESMKGRNALRRYFQSQSPDYILQWLERSKLARLQAETCELLAHLQCADWFWERKQLYDQELIAFTDEYKELRSRVPQSQRTQLRQEIDRGPEDDPCETAGRYSGTI
jgi:hypothetical protein